MRVGLGLWVEREGRVSKAGRCGRVGGEGVRSEMIWISVI